MADVFLLREIIVVWIIVVLIVEVMDGEIQFASPANLSLGKVWYGRKGYSLTLPCVTEEKPGGKFKGAMYNWREAGENGTGYLGFRRTIYGNGTLTIADLQTIDTAQLECVVSKIETVERFVFTHSVVVYYIAEFAMINPFVYTVPNCDEVLTVNKLHDLLEFACESYRSRTVLCPFTARKECTKKTPLEVSESSAGEYRLRVIIEQQQEKTFVVPDCSLKCMKKSIIGHLQQYGDDLLRRLAKKEDRSQGNLFTGYVFEKEELLNRRIRTSCFGGFELFQYILCMPCFPGTYIKFSYQFDDSETALGQCLPCDTGYYQDKFAMDDCTRCPYMGTTPTNGTADLSSCTTFEWRMHFAYYAAGGVLALVSVIALIGMWAIISSHSKKEKEAKRKLEEEQRSSPGSSQTDVTSADVTSADVTSIGPAAGQQQQSSNNAVNVNVNRRCSSTSGVGGVRGRRGRGVARLLPSSEESTESSSDSFAPSSFSASSDGSRRPMLHESSPAIMQSTPSRLLS